MTEREIQVELSDGNGRKFTPVTGTVADIKRRADDGDGDAQYALALAYFHGHETVRNRDQARVYAKRSADNGSMHGMLFWALLIEEGLVADLGIRDAVPYYEGAANAGHVWAAYRLGLLYGAGAGAGKDEVAQDHSRSLHWMGMAAARGDEGAKEHLNCMIGMLAQQTRAQALGATWSAPKKNSRSLA